MGIERYEVNENLAHTENIKAGKQYSTHQKPKAIKDSRCYIAKGN